MIKTLSNRVPEAVDSGDWSVCILDSATESDYEHLVANAPASPVSHTLLWREVLCDLGLGEPVYWIAARGGTVRAALPAFVRRATEGTLLNSLPFVQSIGGVITRRDASTGERAEAVNILTAAMLRWCDDHSVDVACVIGSPYCRDNDTAAFGRAPDFCVTRLTNVLDLTRPVTPRSSVTRDIRKADSHHPRHRMATTIEEGRRVYDLYAESMRRLDVAPHPWSLFERVHARGPSHVRFVWAEVNGEPVSSLILFVHDEVLDYYSVGNTDTGRRLQTGNWLCAQEIEAARGAGVRWWNWGASPSRAVHDFKKHWNGIDLPYPIWGFCVRDVSRWRRWTPSDLAKTFPYYFAIPYDWLSERAP